MHMVVKGLVGLAPGRRGSLGENAVEFFFLGDVRTHGKGVEKEGQIGF